MVHYVILLISHFHFETVEKLKMKRLFWKIPVMDLDDDGELTEEEFRIPECESNTEESIEVESAEEEVEEKSSIEEKEQDVSRWEISVATEGQDTVDEVATEEDGRWLLGL